MKYFSYGSNMSINRMLQRGVTFRNPQRGILLGYEFVINKKSQKDPTVGFANVRKCENSFVEGVLYDVDDITILDRYEGYPKHYNRVLLPVNDIPAYVYIANENWVVEGLKTTSEYKNLILEGKQFLSDDYYAKLEQIIQIR